MKKICVLIAMVATSAHAVPGKTDHQKITYCGAYSYALSQYADGQLGATATSLASGFVDELNKRGLMSDGDSSYQAGIDLFTAGQNRDARTIKRVMNDCKKYYIKLSR